MDAMQILGNLLGTNATSSNTGNQLLTQFKDILGGGGGSGGQSGQGSGITALGSTAVAALQNCLRGSQWPNPLDPTTWPGWDILSKFGLTKPDQDQVQAKSLVQAMINALKANTGKISPQDQQNIIGKLAGLGPEEKEFVRQEMAKPPSLDFIPGAREIYAASLAAIEGNTPAEKDYMSKLAKQLGLDPQSINTIHQQLGIPR